MWLPAIFVLGFLAAAVIAGLPPARTIIFILINTMLIGVSEELMFRGILLHGALSRFNLWPALLLTIVLFGAVHVLNGFTTGDFMSALAQAMAATLSGVCFLAIRLRSGSLFPGMLIHGLFDFALMISIVALQAGRSRRPKAPRHYLYQLVSSRRLCSSRRFSSTAYGCSGGGN